jgi:YD repeat-containing protein
VDARGYVRRFTYDAADRQKTAVDPLGRTTTWWYNQGNCT